MELTIEFESYLNSKLRIAFKITPSIYKTSEWQKGLNISNVFDDYMRTTVKLTDSTIFAVHRYMADRKYRLREMSIAVEDLLQRVLISEGYLDESGTHT